MKTMTDRIPAGSTCVLGVPHDKNSSFLRGTAQAPKKIRKGYFSPSSNLWTESGLDLGHADSFVDLGDLDFSTAQDDFNHITDSVNRILEKNNHLICLGGDHAITYPVVRAHASHYESLTILHLDAHPDLYDSLEGNMYSHACPFARIMEENPGINLIQAGIRTMTGHQLKQADRFNVDVHEMKDGMSWITRLDINGPVYLSVDLDCLDPAFAPGVSHHEPGGMSTREVIRIIQTVGSRMIGADIVEYNPARDLNNVTSMVAAKLLKEIAAALLENRGPADAA